jgi:hypothetical protein
MTLKIRLHGLPDDVAAATAALRSFGLVEVLNESKDHHDHAPSRFVRRYLDVELIGTHCGPAYCPHCGSNLSQSPENL